MSKLMFTTTLAVLGLGVLTTNANALGRRQCGVTYVAPAAAAAPVQPAAPAQTATAQGGYRSFSYQPAVQAPMTYQRTYQRTYRSNVNNSTAGGNGSAFHDAGWKTH